MPHSPALVRVDVRTPPRVALPRGLPSAVVGVGIGVASFVPLLLSLAH